MTKGTNFSESTKANWIRDEVRCVASRRVNKSTQLFTHDIIIYFYFDYTSRLRKENIFEMQLKKGFNKRR